MPDCSYCGETFDDESAYHRHLADAHEGELGPIDRRRATSAEEGSSFPVPPWVLVVVGGALVAVAAGFALLGGGGGGSGEELPEQGNATLLEDVEQFPSQGNAHVDRGTEIQYSTYPPTSGPHYSGTVGAGFYAEMPPLGELIHTLEHGAVVVYYQPAALTPDARSHLEGLAANNTGTWRSVVVVPHPRESGSAFTLTAWGYRLRMDAYDRPTVRAFLAEYLGRGPENPVRDVRAPAAP